MVEPISCYDCTPVLPAVYPEELTLLEAVSKKSESDRKEDIESVYI